MLAISLTYTLDKQPKKTDGNGIHMASTIYLIHIPKPISQSHLLVGITPSFSILNCTTPGYSVNMGLLSKSIANGGRLL